MQALYERLATVAKTPAHILVIGEVGTEKEQAARSLHSLSPWRANPFVVANLGHDEPESVTRLLFGSVTGFSGGAEIVQEGLLAAADGGTLFVDELELLPLLAQVGLVRALDRGEIIPVGGTVSRRVSVRVIAGTERDPKPAIRSRRLRHDLMGRLSVFSVTIPPLRDRLEDIPLLAEHILQTFGIKDTASVLHATSVAFLQSRPWLENVSELRDSLRYALEKAKGGKLEIELFPSPLAEQIGVAKRLQTLVSEWVQERIAQSNGNPERLIRELREIVEEALVVEVLRVNDGKLSPVSRQLGLARQTVRSMVHKYCPVRRERRA
jgi:two-component system nitrogen regulation response regulator GlnG